MKKKYIYGILIVIVVVTIYVLVTYSGILKEEVTTSGIYGKVTLGPLNPVVREGDESKNERPYQATIIVKDKNGSHEVKRFSSGKNGEFKVYLTPGTYLLDPLSKNSIPPTGKSETVTVRLNEFTEVNISYDSGIR